jgi:chromosome partitioning protein
VLVLVRPEQADVSSHYGLIARMNAARMFNPGLRVLFAAVFDKGNPSPAEMAAIRSYTGQVMATALASTLIQAPIEVTEVRALYNEVFTTKRKTAS